MDRFFKGQKTESAVIRGATARSAPIDKRNTLDAVFIFFTASERTQTRMKRAIFVEIADFYVFDRLNRRGHRFFSPNVKAEPRPRPA